MQNINLPCTRCGVCCKTMGHSMKLLRGSVKPGDAYYEEVANFPYEPDPDGACPQLLPDNTCAVYDQRPDLCNANTIYHRHFSHTSPGNFRNINSQMCNSMILVAGLSPDYLIPTPEN